MVIQMIILNLGANNLKILTLTNLCFQLGTTQNGLLLIKNRLTKASTQIQKEQALARHYFNI